MNGKVKLWNSPNIITFGRLLVAPVILVLLLVLEYKAKNIGVSRAVSLAAALIFTVAMVTDMVDGYLARRYKMTSSFGKLMDPLADKLLFLTAMIMMIPLGRISAWIAAILFIREVSITALRGIAVEEGIIIDASHWGKYKAAFLSCATTGLLLHYTFLGVNWRLIGWALLIPGFLLSIGSAIHYTIKVFVALPKFHDK